MDRFAEWNGHGGVLYGKKALSGDIPPKYVEVFDEHTGNRIPACVVVTVGYGYKAGERNAFDFDADQVNEAIARAIAPLVFDDGSPALKIDKSGNIVGKYLPRRAAAVVFHPGVYQMKPINVSSWIQLIADGAVTIKSSDASGPFITVNRIAGVDPLDIEPGESIMFRIGGANPYAHEGTFRLEPYESAVQVETNQVGILCNDEVTIGLDDTALADFRAYGSGAAVRNFRGEARNCQFMRCRSLINPDPNASKAEQSANGGAVFGVSIRSQHDASDPPRHRTFDYTRPSVFSCTFLSCYADQNGGAVAQVRGVESCSFADCEAGDSGGACFDVNSVGGLTSPCQFTRCRAGGKSAAPGKGGARGEARALNEGGALSYVHGWADAYFEHYKVFGDVFFVESCQFTKCEAQRGGAIANCDVRITGCFIDSNKAVGSGGGGVHGATGDIEQCSITRNSAAADSKKPEESAASDHMGGGLHSCSGKITNCIVAANHAGAHGGGLFNCDGALRHLDILQNKAEKLGGGARNCNGPIQNCIIVGNWSMTSEVNANSNQLSNCGPPPELLSAKGLDGWVKQRHGCWRRWTRILEAAACASERASRRGPDDVRPHRSALRDTGPSPRTEPVPPEGGQ